MKNPNDVTTSERFTSTQYIVTFTYTTPRIAEHDLSDVQRTYADVSGSKVVLEKNTIVVTQPLWMDK